MAIPMYQRILISLICAILIALTWNIYLGILVFFVGMGCERFGALLDLLGDDDRTIGGHSAGGSATQGNDIQGNATQGDANQDNTTQGNATAPTTAPHPAQNNVTPTISTPAHNASTNGSPGNGTSGTENADIKGESFEMQPLTGEPSNSGSAGTAVNDMGAARPEADV
ncbi:hypothetical protein BDV96DRAFT_670394 [Lophiotrema nucula]|uniref:Uncharacterized protein n=1 Tax=Lophiotrema nucula TaxID=690887 RepID=A0A6A5YPE0_9PLEO|nr:hypothetical protein BDV96DRAFT_670394 [Lophiotrema nucula]